MTLIHLKADDYSSSAPGSPQKTDNKHVSGMTRVNRMNSLEDGTLYRSVACGASHVCFHCLDRLAVLCRPISDTTPKRTIFYLWCGDPWLPRWATSSGSIGRSSTASVERPAPKHCMSSNSTGRRSLFTSVTPYPNGSGTFKCSTTKTESGRTRSPSAWLAVAQRRRKSVVAQRATASC
jgi:hypothetical protein